MTPWVSGPFRACSVNVTCLQYRQNVAPLPIWYRLCRANLSWYRGDMSMSWDVREANREGCVSYFTIRWLKNNNVAKTPYGIGNYLGPGQSVLSFFASRSFFLIGELLLGNLSKTVVVVGNTPHNRPCGLVGHLIGNRASFLCTKAPMLRVPDELSRRQSHQLVGEMFQAIKPPQPPAAWPLQSSIV